MNTAEAKEIISQAYYLTRDEVKNLTSGARAVINQACYTLKALPSSSKDMAVIEDVKNIRFILGDQKNPTNPARNLYL